MNGKEFIAKILGGEKDLKGIILPAYYDLTDHEEYGTMQQYLKEHVDKRIDLSDSIMIGIVATGIYLPRVIARGTYLRGANLGKAYLGGAYLEEAYLGKANLRGANLREANLIGVKNFETTINFEDATFNCAVMDPETKEIIIAARRATEETYVVE